MGFGLGTTVMAGCTGDLHGRTKMNYRKMLLETGTERRSKSANFDPSRSHLNTTNVDGVAMFTSGEDAADYVHRLVMKHDYAVDQYNAAHPELDCHHRLQHTSKASPIIEQAGIYPACEESDTWTPEEDEAFCHAVVESMLEVGVTRRGHVLLAAAHRDEPSHLWRRDGNGVPYIDRTTVSGPGTHLQVAWVNMGDGDDPMDLGKYPTARGGRYAGRRSSVAMKELLHRDFLDAMRRRGYDVTLHRMTDRDRLDPSSPAYDPEAVREHAERRKDVGLPANERMALLESRARKAQAEAAQEAAEREAYDARTSRDFDVMAADAEAESAVWRAVGAREDAGEAEAEAERAQARAEASRAERDAAEQALGAAQAAAAAARRDHDRLVAERDEAARARDKARTDAARYRAEADASFRLAQDIQGGSFTWTDGKTYDGIGTLVRRQSVLASQCGEAQGRLDAALGEERRAERRLRESDEQLRGSIADLHAVAGRAREVREMPGVGLEAVVWHVIGALIRALPFGGRVYEWLSGRTEDGRKRGRSVVDDVVAQLAPAPDTSEAEAGMRERREGMGRRAHERELIWGAPAEEAGHGKERGL